MDVKLGLAKCELTHCSARLLFMHRARAIQFNSELYCKIKFSRWLSLFFISATSLCQPLENNKNSLLPVI